MARPISMQAGFSVAYVPDRSLPACWIPARAVARVRVPSPALFRSWAEAHFRSWAGLRPGVSQIDVGDTCLHSLGRAEQISQRVAAVAPVVCVVDLIVAAAGRARVVMRFHLPGPAV